MVGELKKTGFYVGESLKWASLIVENYSHTGNITSPVGKGLRVGSSAAGVIGTAVNFGLFSTKPALIVLHIWELIISILKLTVAIMECAAHDEINSETDREWGTACRNVHYILHVIHFCIAIAKGLVLAEPLQRNDNNGPLLEEIQTSDRVIPRLG